MTIFKKLFSKAKPQEEREEAVLVYLTLPGAPLDLAGGYPDVPPVHELEDRLIAIINEGELGEFDGDEFGPNEATLYMYGPDAEKLFAAIEPILRVQTAVHAVGW